MAHTNSTENYGLPQWIGTDKPTFLGDFNSAFGTIDTALKTNSDNATSALNTANSADAVATSANTNAGTALSTANQALTDAQSAQSTASQAVSTANTASTKADNALRASAGNSIENLAPAYDNTLTYAVGDLCTYIDAQNSGKLYKCIAPVTIPMDFNINYWDDVTTSEVYAQMSGGTSIADVVDMITAYVESTAIASRAYAVDDYFVLNSVLYKATQAIAIGDAIVAGTNCSTTNITTELATASDYVADMICLTVENTTTSTHAYSAGDYFILNKTLYRATATITVGTTIVVGTNCVSANISDDITTLNSKFNGISPLRIQEAVVSLAGLSVTADEGASIGQIPTISGYTYRGTLIKEGAGIQGVLSIIANTNQGLLYLIVSKTQTFSSSASLTLVHFFEAN